jgi:hypothetical protein
VIDSALDAVGKAVMLTPEIELQARAVMQTTFFPNSPQLTQRYNDAVSQVAALYPLLGYQLRSKDILRPIINTLYTSVTQSQDMRAAAFLKKMNALLLKEADKNFSDLILKVARKRSLWTRFVVKRHLPGVAFPAVLKLWSRCFGMKPLSMGRNAATRTRKDYRCYRLRTPERNYESVEFVERTPTARLRHASFRRLLPGRKRSKNFPQETLIS